MNFDVSSTALLSCLQSIVKVIASKNILPILDDFLFELKDNTLTITASDNDTRLVTSLEVMNVTGSGLFAISSKILLEPLKELPEQPLTFEINDKNLEVNLLFQNGKYNFIGQEGDVYPLQKPLSDKVLSFEMEGQSLLKAVSRTLFATADDELRPVMNGVYFDMQDDNITFVASDGHKLVRIKYDDVKPGFRASFILPRKPAMLLRSLLAKETDSVAVKFDQNYAYFTHKSFQMICRLIEGRYPNYNSVIPTENPYSITLDRLSFLNALKRVSIFTSSSTGLVRLKFSNNKLELSGQDFDFSTSAEEKMICQYDGTDLQIGFKANFLIEILNNLITDEVIITIADAARPGLVLPVKNEENEDVLMLIMPMMLND